MSQVPFCPTLSKCSGSLRVHEFNGQKHAFSDDWGERSGLSEPERYECQNIFEQYSGRELSDVVVEGHGVRADGKTLIGQPHVRGDKLWTVEDLKRANCVFADPLADSLTINSPDRLQGRSGASDQIPELAVSGH